MLLPGGGGGGGGALKAEGLYRATKATFWVGDSRGGGSYPHSHLGGGVRGRIFF